MNKIISDISVQEDIKKYIEILKSHNISFGKIILFGSFAKNIQHADSDIDLAIISDDFGKDEIQELMDLKKLSIKISDRISPIPLNSSYMSMKYHPLIGEIKKYGRVIYG